MATFGYIRPAPGDPLQTAHEQVAAVREYALGLGLVTEGDPPNWFLDEPASGAAVLRDRPAGGAMLRALRRGDHVVISRLDRAFRRPSEVVATIEDFQARGLHVHVCDLRGRGGADLSTWPPAVLGILRGFGELERSARSERAGVQTRRRLAKGEGVGNAPYGFRYKATYRRLPSGRMRRRLRAVPDEDERRVMQMILAWREERPPLSYDEIRQKLDYEMKAPTRCGRGWSTSRVRRMCEAAEALRRQEASRARILAEVREALGHGASPGPAR
jgi:DNA invertase Pin-like site-specific DNA recombinase